MGATEFYTIGRGANFGDAYNEAVRDAIREYGNDPYNGTISTTTNAVLATRATFTARGASLYAEAHLDDAEKWGPALAVGFAPDDAFTFTKEKFSVTLEEGDDTSWSTRHSLEEKARQLAFKRWGERVHEVSIKEKVRTKVVTTAAAGKPVTKWQAGAYKLFDTKAQAVAAAKQSFKDNPHLSGPVSVKQVKVWPDSTFRDKATAVEVGVQTLSATADVVVTLATPKKVTAPVEGWLFFGLAAC